MEEQAAGGPPEATILSLSPDDVARVGSFLDAKSRSACVLAAKGLGHVHETFTNHIIYFSAASQAKLVHIERIIEIVLARKPHLKNLQISFDGCQQVDVDACAKFRARLLLLSATVAVKMYFQRCKPSFVRRVVWDLAKCWVSIELENVMEEPHQHHYQQHAMIQANQASIANALELMDVADSTAELKCSAGTFKLLEHASLDRVQLVQITIHTPVSVNLQHVSPEKTKVILAGDAMACSVQEAHKLSTVVCSNEPNPAIFHFGAFGVQPVSANAAVLQHSLLAADRGRSHLRLFRVNTLDSSNLSTFCDVAGKVPTSATFELLATSVSCLRFLEHLAKEGFEAVNLLATCVLRARMLQLVLRTPYPVLFRGAYVEAVQGDIGRLKTVHAVRQLMQASDQEAWFFTKYIP